MSQAIPSVDNVRDKALNCSFSKLWLKKFQFQFYGWQKCDCGNSKEFQPWQVLVAFVCLTPFSCLECGLQCWRQMISVLSFERLCGVCGVTKGTTRKTLDSLVWKFQYLLNSPIHARCDVESGNAYVNNDVTTAPAVVTSQYSHFCSSSNALCEKRRKRTLCLYR